MAKTSQGLKLFERAFERHERPQQASFRRLPVTVTSVNVPNASPSRDQDDQSQIRALTQGNPWLHYLHLGQLVQASTRFEICAREGSVVMVKKCASEEGRAILKVVYTFSSPHIVALREGFEYDKLIYLSFDYYRYTLSELLSVPLYMQEPQLQIIAYSVRLF